MFAIASAGDAARHARAPEHERTVECAHQRFERRRSVEVREHHRSRATHFVLRIIREPFERNDLSAIRREFVVFVLCVS